MPRGSVCAGVGEYADREIDVNPGPMCVMRSCAAMQMLEHCGGMNCSGVAVVWALR